MILRFPIQSLYANIKYGMEKSNYYARYFKGIKLYNLTLVL